MSTLDDMAHDIRKLEIIIGEVEREKQEFDSRWDDRIKQLKRIKDDLVDEVIELRK